MRHIDSAKTSGNPYYWVAKLETSNILEAKKNYLGVMETAFQCQLPHYTNHSL